jgi:hypothetical protein
MIFVWQGWGILVPVIGVTLFLVVEALAGQVLGADYMRAHAWPGLVACLLAAVTYWRLGRWLESEDHGHSFMFLPMRWWSFIAVGIGVLFLFKPPLGRPASAREPAPLHRSIHRPLNGPSRKPAEMRPLQPAPPAPAESPEPTFPGVNAEPVHASL